MPAKGWCNLKTTGVSKLNYFSASNQLWKLNGTMLQDKEGLWKSDNFTTIDDLIYIDDQIWKKGELNCQGYFTLENSQVPKVMTAISSKSLEMKGNINFHQMHD